MLTGTLTKIAGGVAIAAIIAAGLTTKLYLNKRDQLAQERSSRQALEAVVDEYKLVLREEDKRIKRLEAIRADLHDQLAGLRNEERETITEIREIIREVDCAFESLPGDAIRLLQQAAGSDPTPGDLQTGPVRSPEAVPNT